MTKIQQAKAPSLKILQNRENLEQYGMGEKFSLHVIMNPKNLFRPMFYMAQNVVFCETIVN